MIVSSCRLSIVILSSFPMFQGERTLTNKQYAAGVGHAVQRREGSTRKVICDLQAEVGGRVGCVARMG